MTIYNYKAVNYAGRKISGEMEASNPIDLEARLKSLDLVLLRCKEKSPDITGIFSKKSLTMKRRELIIFTFQLERMVKGGISVLDGLRDIRDSAESPAQQYAASLLVESIQAGSNLSKAMEEQPNNFPEVYISVVRSGENSGNLDYVLREIGENLKWQDEFAENIGRLFVYPSIVLLVVIAAISFSLIYFLPKVKDFISDTLQQELPWYTAILISTSDFMVKYWIVVFLVPIVLFLVGFSSYKTMPPVKLLFDQIILDLPKIGILIRKIALARFASMFALLYSSGVSVLDSLKYCEKVLGNSYLEKAVDRIRFLISQGSGVSEAFSKTALFPALVIRMINVGETTGNIDDALRTVAYFYQRDVRDFVEKLLKLIEPILTLFLGTLLGYILLAVLLPIYNAISSINLL